MCEFAGYLKFSDDKMDTFYKNSTGVAAIHEMIHLIDLI